MPILELVRIALRRWYVIGIGAVCAVALAVLLGRAPGVYWAQSDVLFLANPAVTGGNPLENQTDSVINFASVVQESIGHGTAQVKLSSPSATLHGAGVRQGYVARLADSGGQWESSFNRAVIKVEVVDSSPQKVRAVLGKVLTNISQETAALQTGSGISQRSLITVETGAKDVSVGYMGSTGGSRLRGLAAVGLVGFGVTCAAAALLDRALDRRRRAEVTPAAGVVPVDV